MAYIKLNGIRSDELGLRMIGRRDITTSSRDYELIEITGVDGAYTQDNDRLNIVEQEFQFVLSDHVVDSIPDISNWLNKSVGFKECELSWDSNYVYYAQNRGSVAIKEILKKYGKLKINLVFHPIKYLKESLTKQTTITNSGVIKNNGQVVSYPKLEFSSASDVTLKINGRPLELRGVQNNLTFDADKQMIYRVEGVTKIPDWSKLLIVSGRPYLDVGDNKIEISGGQVKVTAKEGWHI